MREIETARNEIAKLKKENMALKNRCRATTSGLMCIYCNMECENRADRFRGKVKNE